MLVAPFAFHPPAWQHPGRDRPNSSRLTVFPKPKGCHNLVSGRLCFFCGPACQHPGRDNPQKLTNPPSELGLPLGFSVDLPGNTLAGTTGSSRIPRRNRTRSSAFPWLCLASPWQGPPQQFTIDFFSLGPRMGMNLSKPSSLFHAPAWQHLGRDYPQQLTNPPSELGLLLGFSVALPGNTLAGTTPPVYD